LSVATGAEKKEELLSIAANDKGAIAVAWIDGLALRVQVRSADSWTQLPNPVSLKEAFRPEVALKTDGNPVVVWQDGTEAASTKGEIRVASYNGLSWDDLGTLNTTGLDAAAPSLAIDSSNNIFVTWFEYDGSNLQNIHVKQWDGSSWKALGDALDTQLERAALFPSIALNPQAKPVVVWQEIAFGEGNPTNPPRRIYVKEWTGQDWQQLGDSLNIDPLEAPLPPSLAVGGNGQAVVAWSEYNAVGNSRNIYVKRWTGTAWEQVGSPADSVLSEPAIYPSIAVDSANKISLVWWEQTGIVPDTKEQSHTAQWQGDAWQPLGVLNTADAYYPDLALLGTGQKPVFAWLETNKIFVKQAE
jgi:hypothetical protein